jgi:isopentenyldiphosphate isomerase
MKEECILVNNKDEIIGFQTKRFCMNTLIALRKGHTALNIKENKALHRAFSVFLFNTSGK